jgi:hypothetical protein
MVQLNEVVTKHPRIAILLVIGGIHLIALFVGATADMGHGIEIGHALNATDVSPMDGGGGSGGPNNVGGE